MDKEYTKDSEGNVVETTYNLNYELAKLNKAFLKVTSGTYTGTGTYGESNPNSLTFDFEPKLVIIQCQESSLKKYLLAINGVLSSGPFDESGSSSYKDIFNWNGNTFSWYHTGTNSPAFMQYNESGQTYCYFAIG